MSRTQDLKDTGKYLQLLYNLGKSLNSTSNITEIQHHLLDTLISLEWVTAVCIHVYGTNHDEIILESASGFTGEDLKAIREKKQDSDFMQKLGTDSGLFDIQKFGRYSRVMAAPCLHVDSIIGAITIASVSSEPPDKDLELVILAISTRASGIFRRIRDEEVLKNINRELEAVNSRLKMSEERYRAVVEDHTDVICRFRIDLSITFVNEAYCSFFQSNRMKSIGQQFVHAVHSDDREKFLLHLSSLNSDNPVATIEYHVIAGDGSMRWVEWTNRAIIDDNKTIIEYQAVGRDITERKNLEERLKFMSMHDSLTKLYNRAFFDDQMKRYSDARVLPLGIIVVDLNALKIANDALGHQRGDALISAAANVLKTCFRSSDTVSRIGGDEFGIILPNTDEKTTRIIIDRIKRYVQEHRFANPDIPLSLSIGYSIRKKKSVTMEEVFAEADDRMYREKEGQRDFTRGLILTSLMLEIEHIDHTRTEHMKRVHDLCIKLANEIKLPREQIEKLSLAAKYHDIGMISINKKYHCEPGILTSEELDSVHNHSEIGSRISDAHPFLKEISPIIRCHHERWDGAGYPAAIAGKNIPLLSRIISVCDAYDSMTNNDRYRRLFTPEEAAAEIEINSGLQFDPFLAASFTSLVKRGAVFVKSQH